MHSMMPQEQWSSYTMNLKPTTSSAKRRHDEGAMYS
jgi:hypothetical protein